MAEAYARAARPALDAMAKFGNFLKNSLSSRNNYDWRLGGKYYPRKFRYALQSGVEADNTLQAAERDVVSGARPHAANSPFPCTGSSSRA